MTFTIFNQFFTTYELNSSSVSAESLFLQRLKILSAVSKQFVQFKVLTDEHSEKYMIFTDYDNNKNSFLKLNEIMISDIVPFRSIHLEIIDGSPVIHNYTINRVSNISNTDFVSMLSLPIQLESEQNEVTLQLPPINSASESYEGTVILASFNKSSNCWNIRTTSCKSAFDSYFAKDRSYGKLFDELCKSLGFADWQNALYQLLDVYDDTKYFVFTMVNAETKYLCDYLENPEFSNGNQLFLINVRANDTHIESDVNVQTFFKTSRKLDVSEIQTRLEEPHNKVFDQQSLTQLQGFILRTDDGKLYRSLTESYEMATDLFPNHSNFHLSALHCYMKDQSKYKIYNQINIYLNLHASHPECDAVSEDCKQTIFAMKNMLGFLFGRFTRLNFTAPKSYTKQSEQFYDMLFNVKDKKLFNAVQPFRQVLAKLQTVAIKSKKNFNDFQSLSKDIVNYIKSLGNYDNSFEQFCSMIYHYDTFKTHLNDTIQLYNQSVPPKSKISIFSNMNEQYIDKMKQNIKFASFTVNIIDHVDDLDLKEAGGKPVITI